MISTSESQVEVEEKSLPLLFLPEYLNAVFDIFAITVFVQWKVVRGISISIRYPEPHQADQEEKYLK